MSDRYDAIVDILLSDGEFYTLPSKLDIRRIPIEMLRNRLHAVANDWERFALDVANIKRISELYKIGDDYFCAVLWPDGTEDKQMVEI